MDFVASVNEMNPVANKFQLGNKIAGAIGGLGWYPDTLVEHLFVCAVNGNDQFNGKSPLLPKLKIQAAIDVASTTKHTVIHLLTSFSAANTIYDFDDDAVAAASVTSGNERLINSWVYIYKSNIHIVGEGLPGSIVIKPAAAASAGIVAIKTGMKNISFSNIRFNATTAAAAHIVSSGTVENLVIRDCEFIKGTIQLDLDAGLLTRPVIEDCFFMDAITYALTIAPIYGHVSGCYHGVTKYAGAGGKQTAIFNVANTSGVLGFRIHNNVLHGGDNGASHDVAAIGILIAGTNAKGCIISHNNIFACDDTIDDDGTDSMVVENYTPDGEPNSISSGSASTVGLVLAKSS